MRVLETGIDGLLIFESPLLGDERGTFTRVFCEREMHEAIGERKIRQSNVSSTASVGAVRGMHFQYPPRAEMKIVRCLIGRVFDVAVDLRQGSSTFLQWFGVELSPQNGRAFILPEGCAHGFQVLEPDSKLLYFHTEFYTPEYEGGLRHDEPRVGIIWPMKPTQLSVRDSCLPYLKESFFGVNL